MTYEELLELEETLGKVSKGLKQEQINKIPEIQWQTDDPNFGEALEKSGLADEKCMICFEEFKNGDKIKVIQMCKHGFHTDCLTTWLNKEKRCPMCNTTIDI